ncbi:MAG TPA: cytochrome b/b6 domain-containing protein [Parvibaculum sp.]
MADLSISHGTDGPPAAIHPLVVRITHWINALAMILMILSGWRIYNASPIFGFSFPPELTLGSWLGGALAWHFAAMWMLALNGLVYVVYGFASGHFKRDFLPIRPSDVLRDMRAALSFTLAHKLGDYNSVQKLLYAGVVCIAVLAILSGLAIWKPVQFHPLTWLLGGYDFARIVHFMAMTGIVGFVVVHLALVALVPSTFLPMITGRATGAHGKETQS